MEVVAVTLVACTITEFNTKNSKCSKCRVNAYHLSHPGYFGKKGIRHFREKKNQSYMTTINLEKLWTLVPEASRKNSTESKAAVIDVVKSVSTASLLFSNLLMITCYRATSKCSDRELSPKSLASFAPNFSPRPLNNASKPSVVFANSSLEKLDHARSN